MKQQLEERDSQLKTGAQKLKKREAKCDEREKVEKLNNNKNTNNERETNNKNPFGCATLFH